MSAPEFFNPDGIAAPVGAYSHGALVRAGSDLLYISGQVGNRPDGSVPESFAEQTAQAFANLVAILDAVGLTPANLVKVNQYLVEGNDVSGFRAARIAALGDVRPASTLVYVPRLADAKYLVEIEAVAAR
jgi:2-iminobutanoate/2-iminopropanoate deaminase